MCGRLTKKECEWCGEDFHTINAADKYCDNKCLRNDPSKQKYICEVVPEPPEPPDYCSETNPYTTYRNCKVCGKRYGKFYMTKDYGHCEACWRDVLDRSAAKKFPRRKCKVCDEEFQPIKPTHVFCNSKCRERNQNRKARAEGKIKSKKKHFADKKCKHCDSKFTPKAATHIFCGTECRDVFYEKERERQRQLLERPDTVSCRGCGEDFSPKHSNQNYCSADCRETTNAADRFVIFARDEFKCIYCGRNSDDTSLHIDHIYPWSKGGADTAANLVTSCKRCNLAKGAKVMPESLLNSIAARVGKRNEEAGIPDDKEIKGSHTRGEPRSCGINPLTTTFSNVQQLSQI